MSIVFEKLFYFWLFLLPFSWLIAVLANITAPDKLLAPILMLIGLVKLFTSSIERTNRLIVFLFIVVIFILIKHLSFVGATDLFLGLIIDDFIKLGYFIIPLLAIDNIKKFRVSSWIVVFIAMSGCFSVFLVSTGLMTLPLERFEASRVGVEGLRKAIGLFPSYGDLAQYVAFSVLLIIVAPGVKNRKNNFLRLARLIVFMGVILGILGTQSRNIILSLVISLGVLWLLKKISSEKGVSKDTMMLSIVGLSIVGVSVLGVFITEFINTLASMGGATAAHTAGDRLQQYAAAWEIMKVSPLMGADVETYRRLGPLIEGIHNVWLRLVAHGGIFVVLLMAALLWRCFKGIRASALVLEKSEDAMVSTGYFAALILSIMFYTGMGEMFWALLGVATSIACLPPFFKSDGKPLNENIKTETNDTSFNDYHRYPQLRK